MSFYGRKKTVAEIMEGVDFVSKKKIQNNTVEYVRENGDRVIRLHLTDVLTFTADGDIILNSGGYKTVTTKDRINTHLPRPYQVSQLNRIWYLHTGNGSGPYLFQDGITIKQDGKVEGYSTQDKKLERYKKMVKEYVSNFMDRLVAGEIPKPSAGDCWFCSMTSQDGKSLGDSGGDPSDHLIAHMKERYYVPSLLYCACEEYGVSQMCKHWIATAWTGQTIDGWGVDIVKRQAGRALTNYMLRRLGLAV